MTLDRLRDGVRDNPWISWGVTLGIGLLAFLIRIVNVGNPRTIIFDETYYAKDAWSLLKFGYERNWPDDANAQVVAGTPDVYSSTAEFVVHPPLGKWLIAVGEHWFGMNAFGWRFMACVFGSLLVFATIRLAVPSRSTMTNCASAAARSIWSTMVSSVTSPSTYVFSSMEVLRAFIDSTKDSDVAATNFTPYSSSFG